MADGTPSSQPSRRRQRRLRIACARCRQRKIGCDAASPSCAHCVKVGARCVYEDDFPAARRQPLRSPNSPVVTSRRAGSSGVTHGAQGLPVSAGNALPMHGVHDDTMLQDVEPGTSTSRLPRGPSSHTSGQRSPSPERNLSHQVGLVSLSAGLDPKYIGPSSGYFFTQLLKSANTGPNGDSTGRAGLSQDMRQRAERDVAIEAFRNVPVGLPATESLTKQLSETYFDSIHLQYPFLHRPSHEKLIRKMFDTSTTDEICVFQVTMVLSISALVLSRRSHVELPSAAWCAAAVERFSSLHVENSLRGLQCLLLLIIYAMHSPSSKFNVWSLNYQCIAMVVDLGLQREPSKSSSLTRLQKEMRTRIFWVVYSLDRKLSTMMGRPIGLRDEACDLRLPASHSDRFLDQEDLTVGSTEQTGHMHFALQFFKLARINSEMKYVLHSVNRKTPSYAYPAIRDILQWQATVTAQLDEWYAAIPQHSSNALEYGKLLCQAQYHTMVMLLFLPSPGIPQPGPGSLQKCYESSVSAIAILRGLYAKDLLVYDWSTCHAVILHAFCLIYCVTTVPQLQAESSAEDFLSSIRAASDILSATGEYWTGAKRSRDLLNDLTNKTMLRNLNKMKTYRSAQTSDQVLQPMAPGDSAHLHIDHEDPVAASAYQNYDGDMDSSQAFQWEQQDLSFLFDGLPHGSNFEGDEFDIGSLFIDAINSSGTTSQPSNSRFTF